MIPGVFLVLFHVPSAISSLFLALVVPEVVDDEVALRVAAEDDSLVRVHALYGALVPGIKTKGALRTAQRQNDAKYEEE